MTEKGEKVSEIVSRWASAIAKAEESKKRNVTPDSIEKKVKEMSGGVSKKSGEIRKETERQEAKEFVKEVQNNQENISPTMRAWNEKNKYKELLSTSQAKQKLETAWELSSNKPTWLINNPNEVTSPAAAEYLSTIALLPNELVEDPNVVFQLTAKFAASMSENPKIRAEETMLLNKAILHIRQLRDSDPGAGFTLDDEDLTYTLRGFVLYDEMLDSVTSAHAKPFLQEHQDTINARGRNYTDQELRRLEKVADALAEGTAIELDDQGNKKTFKVDKKELQKYIDRTNRKINELKAESQQEYRQSRKNSEYVLWSQLPEELKRKIPQREDDDGLNLYGFSKRERELILSGDLEKIREFFSDFIAGIYGVGREQKHPELPDQTKFDHFKTALDWVFGSESELIKVQFENAWSDRGKQEYTLKQLAYMPGDIKDKLMAFRKLLGADLDYYASYNELSPLAINFMQEAIPLFLARKQGLFNQAQEYTLNTANTERVPTFLQEILKTNEPGVELNNDILFDKYAEALKNGLLDANKFTAEQITELNKFKSLMEGKVRDQIDVVGFGVQLTDDDVLIYNEARIQWINAQQRLKDLKEKSPGSLTQQESNELENLPAFIHKKAEQQARLQKRDAIYNPEDRHTVQRYQEFSPLEAEVLDMLEDYLKLQGKTPEELLSQRWKIRDAIWSARMHTIGSGHMVDLNSYMVTRPKNIELKSFKHTDNGRYTMISPFMEDIQRIINPELFAWRFGLGGAMGERAFALLRSGQYKKDERITESDAWWEDEKYVTNPESKRVRRMMEYAEQRMGISFSELLGSGFMKGGTYFDATAWRLDEGLMRQIRSSMIESGMSPESWENAALGLQLIVANDSVGRERILRKMTQRTPLVFVEYMAGKEMNIIYQKHRMDQKDQILFQQILAKAQTRLWHDKSLIQRIINLGSESDYNEVVVPFLEQMGPEAIGKKDVFRLAIKDVQEAANRVIPEWSKGVMPMTLALSGIDWSQSYFAKLGTAAMDRRGRDLMNMATARDKMFQIFSNPELLGPEKFDDLIKNLKEYEDTLNAYLPRGDAEKATQQVLRVICLFNQNRAANGIIGWIPGLTTLLRSIGTVEIEHLQPFRALGEIGKGKRGGKNALDKWAEENMIAGRKIKDIPQSLSELVSLSVRFQGPEGNAWDEFKMTAFLNKVQRAGLFQNDPHLLNQLRRELHTTMGWRIFYGLPRKYWWVVPVATIALATTDALNDERKKK